MIKATFDESAAAPGDEQRYIIKTYEETTNSNLAVTYNNRYLMIEDVKKLMYPSFVPYRANRGVEEFLVQRYIVTLKKKPQLYRVDIEKGNFIQVFKLSYKPSEYGPQPES